MATSDWFDWMGQNAISGVAWKLEPCTDTSCILTRSAPVDGPWTDSFLTSDLSNVEVSSGQIRSERLGPTLSTGCYAPERIYLFGSRARHGFSRITAAFTLARL